MKNTHKLLLGAGIIIILMALLSIIIMLPSVIKRVPFSAPEAAYHSWDEILAHPQPITIQTYSTGIMQTTLSAIMNLEHEAAQDIENEDIEIPVNVGIIQHQELGAYLIDAGLDASYVDNPYGTIRGLMVKSYLAKGSQEPNTHIAAILDKENIQLQGVWLTHLHTDHTAGIVDLPKDIPYVAGKNERYINFRFFMQSEHLDGIDELYEIDFAEGIDLPPLGKAVDVFGDGSLWAISSSGHSAGHVIFLINGIDEQVLFTGDACNDHYQFETGIGPGYYSSNLEGGQNVLDNIILFKERFPEVKLVYGHDLKTY
ncbi:MAG: MBL fold metallo-hydrolase [Anaerolineales bacterium]|nr:MBL fold metallo-hydrolase [Chloroflexota bacterium]MBL6980377.1 MBL fold metallo-hydrolase [Anaerolineales bacterium]